MSKFARLNKLLAQKEAIEAALLHIPTVRGVAVGYQYRAGKRTRCLVISVHVSQKSNNIDTTWRIPPYINGIKTDVIELEFSTDNNSHTVVSRSLFFPALDITRYQTLQGGIAIGLSQPHNEQQEGDTYSIYEPGTLGAIVFDQKTQQPLLLSNYHVLAANGLNIGATVMQPSPGDKGKVPDDYVAKVQKAICNEWVDCAVAVLQTERYYEPSIKGIGAVNGAATATVGVAVRKRGRSTQLTYGTIEQIGMTAKTQFMGKSFTFKNQLLVRVNALKSNVFAAHGDSGAVVVDNQNNIVGLLSLISKDGQTAVVNPISAVMAALDICVLPNNPTVLLPQLPLKLHSKGQRVRHLQKCLNALGYTPTLSTDGVFGYKLLAAVKWFQANNGLKSDGLVGTATWNLLNKFNFS